MSTHLAWGRRGQRRIPEGSGASGGSPGIRGSGPGGEAAGTTHWWEIGLEGPGEGEGAPALEGTGVRRESLGPILRAREPARALVPGEQISRELNCPGSRCAKNGLKQLFSKCGPGPEGPLPGTPQIPRLCS